MITDDWKQNFKNEILLNKSISYFKNKKNNLKYSKWPFLFLMTLFSFCLMIVEINFLYSIFISFTISFIAYKFYCIKTKDKFQKNIVKSIDLSLKEMGLENLDKCILVQSKSGIEYEAVYFKNKQITLKSHSGSLFIISFKSLLKDYKINNVDLS